MHFIIMGCGRVGSALAEQLEESGHSVAIIDQNPQSFRRLPASFSGQKVTGVGFDRDVLIQAGVEGAYGFAGVSSGDNSNILAARVVRETFGVQNVVTRIYDPARAEVYQRLGISTVATVSWAAAQVLRQLIPSGASHEWIEPTGQVAILRVDYDPGWIGMPIIKLTELSECPVAYLTRLGQALIPSASSVLQEQDLLHLLAPTDRTDALARLFADPPQLDKDDKP